MCAAILRRRLRYVVDKDCLGSVSKAVSIIGLGFVLFHCVRVVGDTSRCGEPTSANLECVGAVLYGGITYVTGSVSDPDNNPTGWTVYIDGSVSGTATVGADGRFWFRAPYSFPYGEGEVSTQDPHCGALSNTVYFEFQE